MQNCSTRRGFVVNFFQGETRKLLIDQEFNNYAHLRISFRLVQCQKIN